MALKSSNQNNAWNGEKNEIVNLTKPKTKK